MADKLTQASRVTLTTRNGSTFSGILQSSNDVTGKIVLKSVTTAGTKLYGPQNFYRSDLADFQIVNEPKEASYQTGGFVTRDRHSDPRLMFSGRRKPSQPPLRPHMDADQLAKADMLREESGDQGISSGEDGPGVEHEYCHEKSSYTFIDKLSDMFYDAIVYIMEQKVVGLTCEGVNLGRDGTLSLLQVSTETSIIIFDIINLGSQAFDDGLQALLEDKNIVKVIHDCRWISDMVQEKYNIVMNNVFDTQVASAFIYKMTHDGEWPRCVESLQSCLINDLNLPVEKVALVKMKEKLQENDYTVWLQRPLSEKLLLSAEMNVCYNIQLYHVLLNKLLLEFKIGVDLYLNHVTRHNGDIQLCRAEGYILPNIFLDIPKFVKSAETKSLSTTKSHVPSFQNNNSSDMTAKGVTRPAQKVAPSGGSRFDNYTRLCSRGSTSNMFTEAKDRDSVGINKWRRGVPRDKDVIRNGCENSGTSDFCQSGSDRDAGSRHLKSSNKDDLRDRDVVGTGCANSVTSNLCRSGGDRDAGSRRLSGSYGQRKGDSKDGDVGTGCANSVSVGQSGNNQETCSRLLSNKSAMMKCPDMEQLHKNCKDSASLLLSEDSDMPPLQIVLKRISRTHISQQRHDQCVEENKRHEHPCHEETQAYNTPQREVYSDGSLKHKEHNEHSCHEETQVYSTPQREEHSGSSLQQNKTPEMSVRLKALLKLAARDCTPDAKLAAGTRFPSSSSFSCDRSPLHTLPSAETCEHSSNSKSPSSDSDSSQQKAAAKPGQDLAGFLFVPAGFHEPRVAKKKKSSVLKQKNSLGTQTRTSPPCPPATTDDFTYIPTRDALKRQHQQSLGTPSFGFGDPFSEDEAAQQDHKSVTESHSVPCNDQVLEDSNIENFQHSETFQKVLKQVSSLSIGNFKSRLLPPKL